MDIHSRYAVETGNESHTKLLQTGMRAWKMYPLIVLNVNYKRVDVMIRKDFEERALIKDNFRRVHCFILNLQFTIQFIHI